MLARSIARLKPAVRSLAARTRPASSAAAAARTVDHDLLIIGGGPAGLVLASALAARKELQGLSVALLEANDLKAVRGWDPAEDEYSNRVSSITAENIAFLKDIGVFEHLAQERIRPVEEMQIWDGLSSSRLVFSMPGYGRSMATLLENNNLMRACLRRLKGTGVELLEGRKVLSIERDEHGWPVVERENGDKIRARLLIGADGANSPVKKYSEIETFGRAYDAQGLVATLKVMPGDAMHTAFQRFLPTGPIAFLPIGDEHASLVWSTTPALAAALKKLSLPTLSALVGSAFAIPFDALERLYAVLLSTPEELDAAIAVEEDAAFAAEVDMSKPPQAQDALPPSILSIQPGSVASFPLRLSHTSSYLGLPLDAQDRRTALVGDAAHTVHPLAGQGLNMGLSDASSLVAVLSAAAEQGADVGSYNALRAYPKDRYVKNHAMLSATDHLSDLYGSKNKAVVWARSNGLEAVQELAGVKRFLMRQAGAFPGEQKKGFWETVAGGIRTAGKVGEMAKAMGGLAAASLAASSRRV